MGDPAGIGPEIILKALSDSTLYSICRPVVFGDRGVLAFHLKKNRQSSVREISHPSEAEGDCGKIDLVEVCRLDVERLTPGVPNVEGGVAMVNSIFTAVDMAKRGGIAAMVTCPISKALMNLAGYHYEGHTQLIAALTHTERCVMMLAGRRLRIALATIHRPLKDVPDLLSVEGILNTIRITSKALYYDFGLESPRLAVAGHNPHAG
jgi:4-hydroxythreonine-4-phosphate dehydrogenase